MHRAERGRGPAGHDARGGGRSRHRAGHGLRDPAGRARRRHRRMAHRSDRRAQCGPGQRTGHGHGRPTAGRRRRWMVRPRARGEHEHGGRHDGGSAAGGGHLRHGLGGRPHRQAGQRRRQAEDARQLPLQARGQAGVRAGKQPVVGAAGQADVGVPPPAAWTSTACRSRSGSAASRRPSARRTPLRWAAASAGVRPAPRPVGRGGHGALGKLVHAAGGASPGLAAVVVDGLVPRDHGDAGTDQVEGLPLIGRPAAEEGDGNLLPDVVAVAVADARARQARVHGAADAAAGPVRPDGPASASAAARSVTAGAGGASRPSTPTPRSMAGRRPGPILRLEGRGRVAHPLASPRAPPLDHGQPAAVHQVGPAGPGPARTPGGRAPLAAHRPALRPRPERGLLRRARAAGAHPRLEPARGRMPRQTARMLVGVEIAVRDRRPDGVIVYGDTNSTLAGAMAAAKEQVPVAHVEAGLRSFDRRMPEEINRVIADSLSSLLLCPSQTAVDNLGARGHRRGGARRGGRHGRRRRRHRRPGRGRPPGIRRRWA